MKKTSLLLLSVLFVLAIAFTSCGAKGEKAKAEEAKVECNHAKTDSCSHAKQDSCAHAKQDTCAHEKKTAE